MSRPEVLVILIDFHEHTAFTKVVECLIAFGRAFCIAHRQNELGIVGYNCKSEADRSASGTLNDVCFLYRSRPGRKHDRSSWMTAAANMGTSIAGGIGALRAANSTERRPDSPRSTLASAMSRALCFISKTKKTRLSMVSRILVLHTSEADDPSQYMSVMNAIFCAQKTGVLIDACLMSKNKSSFLQRAAEITKGVYKKLSPEYQEGLIMFLFTLFFSNSNSRELLKLPRPDEMSVEFNVTCFLQAQRHCCQGSLAKAFICSVCLSIFCKKQNECPICKRKVDQIFSGTLRGPKTMVTAAAAATVAPMDTV